MKKIIIGTGIVAGSFIVMVGLIFVVLTIMEPVDEVALNELPEQISNEMKKTANSKSTRTDSLRSNKSEPSDELILSESANDSLLEKIKFMDKLIKGYKKTVDQLNEDIIANNNQSVSVKELAKTYESMKTEEMRPILKNVDNETVLSIYKNMNSRTRKNLLIALSDKRASKITQLLAKKEKKETKADTGDSQMFSNPSPNTKPAQAISTPARESKMVKGETTPKQEMVTALPKPSKSKKKDESLLDSSILTNTDTNGYRVQLCSGSSKRQADTFKSKAEQQLSVPLYVKYEANRFKVRAGNFSEMDSAVNFCNRVKENGFKDAWVVKSQIESLQLAQP